MYNPIFANSYALLLNGPPYSGKDTGGAAVCDMLEPYGEVRLERFSMPLKKSVCSWLGIRCAESGHSELEAVKEEIIPELGVSYRTAQIELSEKHMKRYGNDVFGRLLVRRMAEEVRRSQRFFGKDNSHYFIIPDSGFRDEAIPVVDEFPPDHVAILQVRRYGCNFNNDSRSYVEVPGATLMYVDNNGQKIDYENDVCRMVKKWLAL